MASSGAVFLGSRRDSQKIGGFISGHALVYGLRPECILQSLKLECRQLVRLPHCDIAL